MVDLLLAVGVVVHALLLVLWPGRGDEVVPVEAAAVEEPKPMRRPKPFRARKAFREVRREFEDAHDPQRLSRTRVERFARRAVEAETARKRAESSGTESNELLLNLKTSNKQEATRCVN